MLGEWRTAPERQYARPDLRYPDPGRNHFRRVDVEAGRYHRHRHAGRRWPWFQSAEIPSHRRQGRDLDQPSGNADQYLPIVAGCAADATRMKEKTDVILSRHDLRERHAQG